MEPLTIQNCQSNPEENAQYYKACCCSVTKSCPTLHDPMGSRTSGFPVPHHLPEFAQVHVR